MKRKLVQHEAAHRELIQIFVYIGEQNLAAAERFLDAVNADLKQLVEMPNMGAIREFRNPKMAEVRSWPVTGFRNYLLFYRASRTELQLLHVLHGARNIAKLFDKQP